ncbi:protein kinase [Streptomyces phyllanthi]|uniref:non-specific serine/threonine protein kinase n=1 Tax=Streptomyces phyllanthi TaxID=1803180 RepID=A0A5N8W606_9ACTN|nr:serine/threonine-protein kinase [Streptomyces phyllanthi]MPY42779.1 protein kinase [Streptomyces phyllanthi]
MSSGAPESGAGRVIAGRYLLLNRLGTGGMGHVWLAHDQRLDCEVALKEIVFRDPGEAARDRSARIARARTEARHAAWLRHHQNVVTVHDVLEHEGLPWIVMEYVPGAIDLRALVARRGPLPPAECARVGLAVLDALTAGHERGIMHRDVKPANILLAPDRTGSPYARVLLTDYGISVQPGGDEPRYTGEHVLVGTSGYLAPERAQGGPPTAAADLFSLGCTLYYGAEGHGPFERDTDLAALTAVVLEEPAPPLRAGALEPLLAAMLTKDPGRRITAAETEAALSAILMPRSRPRTQPDPGSEPPWAIGATETASPGQAAPLPLPPVAPVAPVAPVDESPFPRSTGRHGRKRPRVLLGLLAGVLGAVLAVGGAWYALANLPPVGGGKPYGSAVGLDGPLEDGDCVDAVWPSTPFTGTPGLQRVRCLGNDTDGQVMALFEAGSAQDAAANGHSGCEERTKEIRGRLADVRAYAVLPTEDGFETAGRKVACLVLGASRPVYGPLGEYREMGMRFHTTANMQKQDCLKRISDENARLVACEGPHDQRVLGFARLDPEMTYDRAQAEATGVCRESVKPIDYGYDPSVYESDSWISENDWNTSTHFAVCTVRTQNGGTMEADAV